MFDDHWYHTSSAPTPEPPAAKLRRDDTMRAQSPRPSLVRSHLGWGRNTVIFLTGAKTVGKNFVKCAEETTTASEKATAAAGSSACRNP
jgi:hypothetical protein